VDLIMVKNFRSVGLSLKNEFLQLFQSLKDVFKTILSYKKPHLNVCSFCVYNIIFENIIY